MTQSWAFLSKCRLCGEVDNSTRVGSNRTSAIVHAMDVVSGTHSDSQAPTLIDAHVCKDGEIGVRDFIGMRETKS